MAVSLLVIRSVDLPAQVDPRGHWRTWHTPHFRISARAEHANVATAAASEAERAYAALAGELRVPRGTIDIVLYDNVDFSNGFATIFPTSRISIFLTPPASEIGLGRYDEWLRLVITHELTHVFHLDRAGGIWGLAQHIFGRAPILFPNVYRPGWVLEGLAAYYESRFTAAGRGRGAFHSQLLLAAAQNHHWPAPGDANFSNSRWPGGLEPYAFGSRFFTWESEVHGDTVIPRFIEHTSRRLWPLTISGPLTQAGGRGLVSDWRGFRAQWDSLARPVTGSTIIARGLRYEPRPRLSPDGRRLAFVLSDGHSRERVVIRAVQTGKEIASKRVNGSPELAWVGEDLVLAQLSYTNPVEIRSHLFRWTPGGAFDQLNKAPRLTRPFAITGTGVGAVQLGPARASVVQLTGDSVIALPVPQGDAWAHVAVSPDGSRLAGARHANGQWDILLWSAGAPEKARLVTDDAALDDDPSWSADGEVVTFTSERTGVPQIYQYHVVGGALVQLTDEPTGARDGEVAGDTIYFSTLLHDGYAVMSHRSARRAATAGDDSPSLAARQLEPVAVRESRYSPWQSLVPRYWLPFGHDAGASGRFLGAATTGADVVGRTAYAIGVTHGLDNARWEGFLALAYTRWSALSLDASAQQFWDVGPTVTLSGLPVGLSQRDRAAGIGGTLRRRWWRSEISARVAGELTQEAFFAPSTPPSYSNPTFIGGVVSVSAGYINRQALSISSEDGVQISALHRRRSVRGGPGWSDETRATVRGYLSLPLPGFAHWVLAGRVAGAVSGGPNAKRFALGGESSGRVTLVPGVGFGNGSRDFGLRGYPSGPGAYTRVVVGTAEVRVPLFLIGKAVWKLPFALNKVSLSAFGESGGGWQSGGQVNITRYRDVGAELVVDVGINLDLPLRIRLGAAQALVAGLGANKGDWRGYVALGSAF